LPRQALHRQDQSGLQSSRLLWTIYIELKHYQHSTAPNPACQRIRCQGAGDGAIMLCPLPGARESIKTGQTPQSSGDSLTARNIRPQSGTAVFGR
jgi:hypothetical protein